MRKSVMVALPLLALAGCESATEPPRPGAVGVAFGAAISDGAHEGPAGFYFLPPMVERPSYDGVFDPEVAVVVEICEEATECGESPHARFSTTDGSGSTRVRVDEDDEQYLVNWHTRRTGAEAGRSYRVRVLEDGFELGHADVAVVRNGREKKAVPDGTIALVAGQTLAVSFRIEMDRERPAEEPEEPEIVPSTITAGPNHSCGLDVDGNAHCWGRNNLGQLGDGTTGSSNQPVAVAMPDGVTFTAISAGLLHTVAVDATGAAYAWGVNTDGRLGTEAIALNALTRVPVAVDMPDGVSFAAISAGQSYTVALTTAGAAYAWGDNRFGQLGDGTRNQSTTPVAVDMPDGVAFAAIDAGATHTAALATTGGAYAWGENTHGRLGDGTTTHRSSPAAVIMPDGARFSAISAGEAHTAAAAADGGAYAWGANGSGQLGDGSSTQRSRPTAVSLPAGVAITAVSAGGFHTVALASTGDAYAWGANGAGQLGDGTIVSRTEPVAVLMPAGVAFTALAGGGHHTLAVSSTGAGYAWGENGFGQLGDGSNTRRSEPVAVAGGVTFQQ